MATPQMRFDDGTAYDRMMGTWSRIAGAAFIDWLAPAPGLTWADIGCGTGAFCELLLYRCAPSALHGIDPSAAQLDFARARPAIERAEFRQGDAMALPYADNSMDAAVMALVLFFVPDPARGIAEMARVVKPGGSVSAYVWDSLAGGSPAEPVVAELRGMGFTLPAPPSEAASRLDAMTALWRNAGLEAIETTVIHVRREFPDFEDFWSVSITNPRTAPTIAGLQPEGVETLRARLRTRLPADAQGRIGYGAWANAIKGRKPAA